MFESVNSHQKAQTVNVQLPCCILCIQNVSKNEGPCEMYGLSIANDSLYETYSPSIVNAGPSQCEGLYMDVDFLQ